MAAMFRNCWMSFRLKLRNKDLRILRFGSILERLLKRLIQMKRHIWWARL